MEARLLALKIGAPLTLDAATHFSWKQLVRFFGAVDRFGGLYKKNVKNCIPLILDAASQLKTIGQTPGSFWESLVLFTSCGFPVLETIILMTSENN